MTRVIHGLREWMPMLRLRMEGVFALTYGISKAEPSSAHRDLAFRHSNLYGDFDVYKHI